MKLRAAMAGAMIVSLSLGARAESIFPRKRRDDEAKLLSKLQRERDPVKKAKLETRLGRLSLQQAFTVYDQGHYDQCWKLLDVYLSHMNNAWADLSASGHQAATKPDGFKQLDIALRESRRDLEDFETRITFAERQAAKKITAQTMQLRSRVFQALFPGAVSHHKKESLAGSEARESQQRKGPK